MSAARGRVVVFALVWMGVLGSCALPPQAQAPATLEVQVIRGLPTLPAVSARPVPGYLLLDATLSMETRVAGRATRYDAAREVAGRYLAALPEASDVRLRLLGVTTGAACGPAIPVEPPAEIAATVGLAQLLRGLPPPRSESSLAAAFDDVARDLDRRAGPEIVAARVVVVSDFEPACGGDLCAAASRLVARGAKLELVAMGEAALPACLEDLGATAGPRAQKLAEAPPAAPAFRVHRLSSEGPLPLAERQGRAGETAVALPPGQVVVIVELDPDVHVGPIDLAAGEHARVRVLDFPALEPSVREVWVERGAAVEAQGTP